MEGILIVILMKTDKFSLYMPQHIDLINGAFTQSPSPLLGIRKPVPGWAAICLTTKGPQLFSIQLRKHHLYFPSYR